MSFGPLVGSFVIESFQPSVLPSVLRTSYLLDLSIETKMCPQNYLASEVFRSKETNFGIQIKHKGNSLDMVVASVADPGSGIRCLFDPWIRVPE